MYFCFIYYADCVDHIKLENSERDGNTRPPDLLLRNLYSGQEAMVRIRYGTRDWFQIGKGVHQGCILSPCLLNLYAEYIMRNAGLEEVQAGIKIAGRCARFGSTYTKIGTIQRRLAWLLRKDDTQIREAFHIFYRQNTLWHTSQQDPLWPTSQNIGNKSKNKQMGPN